MRVVLIDDDIRCRRRMRPLLQLCGYEIVAEADDGLEAMAKLQNTKADLIITDYHMPQVDGITMTRSLRSRGQRTPIVMISGEDDPNVKTEASAAGVTAYITKPFDPKTFCMTLRQVCESAAQAA